MGGAVVSIYTEGRYVSEDLDFVTWRSERQLKPLMEQLGFRKKGFYWIHDDTDLFVQFVNSPVMVGNKHVVKFNEITTAVGKVRLISPLDSVLDRFCWYLQRADLETLEQMVDMIVTQDVSLDDVAHWLESEDGLPEVKQARFAELQRRVSRRRDPQRL